MRLPFSPKLILSKDEINPNPSRVGKAVYDILSKPQPDVEVGEILSEYAKSYVKELSDTISVNREKYRSPFHIVVLFKKEFWATNVQRQWFIARQTCPKASDLIDQYPNFGHAIYSCCKASDEINLLWTLPGKQEIEIIARNPSAYDFQLVDWVIAFYNGTLDKEAFLSDAIYNDAS